MANRLCIKQVLATRGRRLEDINMDVGVPREDLPPLAPLVVGARQKLHLAATSGDHIRRLVITAGNVADIRVAPHLTCGFVAHSQVIADKAYDCDAFAQGRAARQVSVVIPPRAGRLKPRLFDKTAYRMRNAVERLFVHLNGSAAAQRGPGGPQVDFGGTGTAFGL